MSTAARSKPLFDPPLLKRAVADSLRKLDPRHQVRNPVMFVVYVGAVLTTLLSAAALAGHGEAPAVFSVVIAVWLWFTVLFANFAEALAEGRGKAQAAALRAARRSVPARVVIDPQLPLREGRKPSLDLVDHEVYFVANTDVLRKDQVVVVEAGELIPLDGEVILGVASVDESAVTGESAPVIRESGGDRSAVTGGTRVLSDWLVIRITANPGESLIDRMISLVEGAKRQQTPNEIALSILLAAMTIIFLLAVATLLPLSIFTVQMLGRGDVITVTVLVALLVCLIPTTIGGLLSAIGIAGMDRMIRANVVAMSGRAVEAAGDVDTLLLDKTGTITLGNREAVAFIPAKGVQLEELVDAAQLASLADETPEGRSIMVLAKKKYGLRARKLVGSTSGTPRAAAHAPHFVPFSAQTRMSGVDLGGVQIRKGAAEAIARFVHSQHGDMPPGVQTGVDTIAGQGGTPLVVAKGPRVLGLVWLKDIVKGGIRERFARLRQMGIKTIMITGDNPLTAASIAAEAGVDDYLAAKEAGNMVDLDSNPTKLIEIVEIGKQLLITRGALTTFSIANDVSKYFAIIPAAFTSIYPGLAALNVMRLATPQSAILSAVIFNALIIVALIPLALRGVHYRPAKASKLLSRNLLLYGLGGLIVPFFGIKLIDLLLVALQLT
jgi:K+-transporting ATPase ATPase B chain